MEKVLLRADHVGSLLRSGQVKIARKSFYEKHTIDKAKLTEDELTNILNRFSVGMLSDNLDEEDKNLARKLNFALNQIESEQK